MDNSGVPHKKDLKIGGLYIQRITSRWLRLNPPGTSELYHPDQVFMYLGRSEELIMGKGYNSLLFLGPSGETVTLNAAYYDDANINMPWSPTASGFWRGFREALPPEEQEESTAPSSQHDLRIKDNIV